MTSKFWVKGCKFSAVVGTTLGLLMPALPLLAFEPFSNLVGDSSFAPSQELLIAQSDNVCSGGIVAEEYTTSNYYISLCQTPGGSLFFVVVGPNDIVTTIHDVTVNGGSFEGTSFDNDGTPIKYVVGDGSLLIYNNGDQIVHEATF